MKTKIICTIGPASVGHDVLRELISAGMNFARSNCSHAGLEETTDKIKAIKHVREETGADVKIILDTKGPDVRIGRFKGESVVVEKGQAFKFYTKDCTGDKNGVFVNHPNLWKIVKPGQELRLVDGMIVMTVETSDADAITARVVTGGKLSDKKSLAVPGCDLQLPFLSEADKIDLLMGIDLDCDIVAASFVGSAKDVFEMRDFLKKNGKNMPIISKIESKWGIQHIDEIIKASDGIMVARGDLGVEYPIEQIPALQKMIVQKTKKAGKFIIVATEMLESMIERSRPTRAETTDIANAVWDGADCVMLSGETAMGKYPVQCVQYMARIAAEAEKSKEYFRK